MLAFNLVSLAKNHNFFGTVDQYMKEFSRIIVELGEKHPIIAQRLERALG